MLLAQVYAKEQAKKEAKHQELVHLATERAQQLGGNTMPVEAANWRREQSQQSYASPQELVNIYSNIGGSKKDDSPYADLRAGTDQRTVAGPLGDQSFSGPTPPGDVAAQKMARQSELIDPWSQDDDPYGLKYGGSS
jgi:hypothetical protein